MAGRTSPRPGRARPWRLGGGGARAWQVATAAAAAAAVGALAPLRGSTAAAEQPRAGWLAVPSPAFSASGGPPRRRAAAAGLGLLLAQPAGPAPARAEAPPGDLELKTGRSKAAKCELRVPTEWQLQEDPLNDGRPQDKHIFAFLLRPVDGILAARVDTRSMAPFLRSNGFRASPEDLVADEWSTVVSGPISQESMAKFIMGIRKANDTEQEIIDSSMAGNAFSLHMKRNVKNNAGETLPPRYVSAKALLRNGTITTAYVNAPYSHWEPGFLGEYPGKQLDAISQSLRLLN